MITGAMPKASQKTQENLISFHVIKAMAQGRCPEEVVEGRSEGRSVQAMGPAQNNTNAI
jgi:hypothetical protein